MLSFLPKNPQDVMEELRVKFKARRVSLGYTQQELSTRSGVSLGSLKRFESSGQIALESLLKLALVLECLGDFSSLCEKKEEMFESMDETMLEVQKAVMKWRKFAQLAGVTKKSENAIAQVLKEISK